MNELKKADAKKMPTGIGELDECLRGGFPRKRTTLIAGGAGAGKTVLALQTLVNGAKYSGEPGIFVAFEEHSRQIIENAETFSWELRGLSAGKLFFLDAMISPESVRAGEFDLAGLLAIVGEKARAMKARRIVFDSIDILLDLIGNPQAAKAELFRLQDWLLTRNLTAIVTAKTDDFSRVMGNLGPLQFMVECVIRLDHRLMNGVSLRNLWIMKFRGSEFTENEIPIIIGKDGMEIMANTGVMQSHAATRKRLSTGVKRLDTMLGGGYFVGSSILISGAPGTAKSSLSAAFAEAACKRGESTLYISFDSSGPELVRNFLSIGIDLGRYLRSGKLIILSMSGSDCSSKEHYLRIRNLVKKHKSRCLVVDPLSALIKGGGEVLAQSVAEQLIHFGKSAGLTMLNTSLLTSADNDEESTPIQVSTIADTWIHLSYLVKAGERNRALTIVKARGMNHSNQVRELVLHNEGITLADTYTAEGEVLMGTMRWQKENAERIAEERVHASVELTRREIELTRTELNFRKKLLEMELEKKEGELRRLVSEEEFRKKEASKKIARMNTRRRADGKKDT